MDIYLSAATQSNDTTIWRRYVPIYYAIARNRDSQYMYAHTADYSEWQTGCRAAGLVFSASSMTQKVRLELKRLYYYN